MNSKQEIEGIKYLQAKKRVEKVKGFYSHFIVYLIVNTFLSGIIIYGLMHEDGDSFSEVIRNFGVYAVWFFWGIGIAFHWLGVFGFNSFFGKKWEEKKLKEYINKEEEIFKL